jgi:predicted O-methyltransferase YrrM
MYLGFSNTRKVLKIQCHLQGAKKVLEIGTLGGYSMTKADRNVHVTSTEIELRHGDVAIENIRYAGVSEQVDVLLGPALDILPELAKEIEEERREKLDLIFIDAYWDVQWEYFDWDVKMMEKGSRIRVDNMVRQLLESGVTTEMAEDSEPGRGMKELVERFGQDRKVDAVVIQTVGVKSYNGFLIAIVK